MPDITQQLAQFAASSPVQFLSDPFPEPVSIRVYMKRDDLLHPLVSGNKWRKLKYNLLAAGEQGQATIMTFGGAYSNHLYATAAAGRVFGFRTIGIVRGEELASAPLNSTLQFCQQQGMQLHFVDRASYRRKEEPAFLDQLTGLFGPCYVVPEGGTNALAIRGTAEIMPEIISQMGYTPDYVSCAVGTGGTVMGLAASAPSDTRVLGFLVLKAPDFQLPQRVNCQIRTEYHFGGYAKVSPVLLGFIRAFEQKTGILIEQVYTGKMLYGIYDLARQGFFPAGANIMAVHTGGLQGRSQLL
ncbi:1-aminocyclopropane-1-carboxylate deaminase/D-cysteine desulfhydrase [Spirosoma utsteinense]|uniref:1-aminocyclopropane-1-carboxylate deaminase/D-cysteine desulfhydrase n=1 Tax=Spirosoma utsteinense TaxID=2585773 RepID=A0ABR6VZE2_9BACT|nr:pyridoxal-phosphate dependent enzyme [Spirosoma utsteinense]MBC3784557.1 1-aminocyclopropane-1-carboxylate deaminase/D-cysteine desulfhydrase [Spirosoma utsteinense]MBC3789691.1 1-aminocyclopropane-1-carboxylate deaminase/D-cysteine desulfhydrase [Spirosoma utsteinense]